MPNPMQNVRCVNYQGVAAVNGYDMWTDYDGPTIAAHFAKAKALGFNTIRLSLQANHGFTFPTPTSSELAKWTDMQARAVAAGVKIRPVFFNYAGPYLAQTANLQTHAAAIWAATNPAVISEGVELENELTFTDTVNNASYAAFLTAMVPYMKTLTGKTVTSAMASYANLAAMFALVNGTAGQPDFYDLHFYSPVDTMNSDILAAINLVGGVGNLFLGECGLNTVPVTGQSTPQVEQAARDYLRELRWRASAAGLPEPAPFVLFDFTAGGVFTNDLSFGLYRSDGVTLKPAGQLYLDCPIGQLVTTDFFNSTMQGIRVDNVGNLLPWRWNLAQNAYASVAPDPSTLINGLPALKVTAGGTAYNPATPPALQAVISGPWPRVQQGQMYTFKIRAKAAGSYGTPQLGITFYGDDGLFKGGATSTPLTLSSAPSQQSISCAAPAGATWIRLTITTLNNTGAIWFGAAELDGPPARLLSALGARLRRPGT